LTRVVVEATGGRLSITGRRVLQNIQYYFARKTPGGSQVPFPIGRIEGGSGLGQ
jgi:hypothetical protein